MHCILFISTVGWKRELEGFGQLRVHSPRVRGNEAQAEKLVDDHDDDDDHDDKMGCSKIGTQQLQTVGGAKAMEIRSRFFAEIIAFISTRMRKWTICSCAINKPRLEHAVSLRDSVRGVAES
jgi:hypothetical protein